MTTTPPTTTSPTTTASELDVALEPRKWRVVWAYAGFTLLSLILFVVFARAGSASFQLTLPGAAIQLPTVVLPVELTGTVITAAMAILTVITLMRIRNRKKVSVWSHAAFALLFVIGFLTWAAAGETLPVPGLLVGSIGLSVPLAFGAIGGVLSERVGVVNVAIEGQLLAGAFGGSVTAAATGNPYVGLIGAMIAGALVSVVLALFTISYWVNQVIVGIVLNVFVTGLTTFLYVRVLTVPGSTLNSPPRFPDIAIPGLSQIPLIGPALFNQSIIVYALYVTLAVAAYALYKTPWGLRVRAVGEHPRAADTTGIQVNRLRFWTVLLAGAIAGLGGAYFTLGSIGSFQQNMTGGMGYIALAAVIFGKWDPVRSVLAALLFGFATNLQYILGLMGSPVPSEFLLMLPYVVTIIAVAGFIGSSRGPAAAGTAYSSR